MSICAPSPWTVRSLTVMVVSTTLFLRNVTAVAPSKPAPVTVTERFDVPAAAVAGVTAVMNGGIVTATPADVDVAGAGSGVAATWTLTGTANVVADPEPV